MSRILTIMLVPEKGGLETVGVNHAVAFKNAGCESFFLCLKSSPYVKTLSRNQKPTSFLNSSRLYNVFSHFKIIRTILKLKPDIICVHGNRAISFIYSSLISFFIRKHDIKRVATTHNTRNKRFAKLDGVFAISQFLKTDLQKTFGVAPEKIIYCPNSVQNQGNIRESILERKIPVIGTLSRLVEVKGLDLLLKAALLLKEQNADFQIIIAGDGELKTELEKFCAANKLSENVKFAGWISDKKKFFDSIDIFCLPSRSEAFPISLLEALSYGKPAVVSDNPGPVEIVSQYGSGIIFPRGNVQELTQSLNKIISDKTMYAQMSRNAIRTIADFYSTKLQEEKLLSMVKLLNSKG